jgi:hypothetical protein
MFRLPSRLYRFGPEVIFLQPDAEHCRLGFGTAVTSQIASGRKQPPVSPEKIPLLLPSTAAALIAMTHMMIGDLAFSVDFILNITSFHFRFIILAVSS